MEATAATEIVRKLRENGYDAYFVGGCVRDMVMGIEPSDYDIATAARPEDVTAIFPRTEPIGVRFGVTLVIHRGHPYEVATFRSDEAYVDGRRPTGVVFTGPEEDVLRRDFTMNGLLYDPIEDRVLDYVDGRADIDRRIVRAIGDPHERFAEDKLRILRAIRFGARFGYSIEDETWAAVRAMAPGIRQVSSERIRDELVRILIEGRASRGIRLLEESGLRQEILPELEWNAHIEASLELMAVPVEPDFALAVLLHECGSDPARGVADRLRFSNREIDHVHALVREQGRFSEVRRLRVASLKRFLRRDRFADHLELHWIHTRAGAGALDDYDFVSGKLAEWSSEDLAPRPLISGEDLISLGMEPGPSFTTILAAVEDEQLEGRLSDRESALRFVRDRFR